MCPPRCWTWSLASWGSRPVMREAVHGAGQDPARSCVGDPGGVRAEGFRVRRGGADGEGGRAGVEHRRRSDGAVRLCRAVAAGERRAAAGISRLTRLVARVRDEATERLWDSLSAPATPEQRIALDRLLEVPPGGRVSELERWRTGPAKASGPGMVKALDLASEVGGAGFGAVKLDQVPQRRLAELARYGMSATAFQLKKHPPSRRRATLVATVQRLRSKTIDDALELLDLLMVTELLGRAQREADKQTVRRHPQLAKASARLAVAVEMLLAAGEDVRLGEVRQAIDAVVPRSELRDAVATVTGLVPPPEAEDDGGWRAEMCGRYAMVSAFVKILTEVIESGANVEGDAVLAAMLIDSAVLPAAWKRLVFGHPARTDGLVDRNAYVFCVLVQFHRHLKCREIYAPGSSRWRDPAAQLLDGPEWDPVKNSVLTDLGLPEDPDALLARHVVTLDAIYRAVAGRLPANTAVRIDTAGKVHVASVKAIEEPPSLIDLRKRVEAMMPRRYLRGDL